VVSIGGRCAAVKRSCKPAATPLGFPTSSTQTQLDHLDLRCSNIIPKQTHSTHNSVYLGEYHYHVLPQFCPADSRTPIETKPPIYRAHSKYLAHTAEHTITRSGESLWDFGVAGVTEEAIWTRERCREGFSL
jgi:hypothetical protein